jgi:Pyruvate/2-oxoacid:ferredoxin oxidoreductase delta subunit
MCRFCVKHGDGQKWYLQAKNYAYDLTSDLKRRGFLIDFLRDFDQQTAAAMDGLSKVKRLPGPVRRAALGALSRRMQATHFGQPVPIEDCEAIFDITTSIVRVPCVCRNFAGTEDNAYCLAITTRPLGDILTEAFEGYSTGPDTSAFQSLTSAEAMELLRSLEEEGMMHSVWTFLTPFIAGLCNCRLADGCMAMRATLQEGFKIIWKGEYVARVDADLCKGCKQCVELCPFDAIEFDADNKKATVRLDLCYGCGTCRAACSAEAISLTARAEVPEVANDW